jgi:hypothetical protein
VIAGLAFAIALSTDGFSRSPGGLLFLALGIASTYQAVLNLWPRRINMGLQSLNSDGANILAQLRGKIPEPEAQRAAMHYFRARIALDDREFALAKRESDCAFEAHADPAWRTAMNVMRSVALLESDDTSRAIGLLESESGGVKDEGVAASVANNLAWAYLLRDEPLLLEKGLELAASACRAAPWEKSFQVTKICLLAASANQANGRAEEAALSLEELGRGKTRGARAAYTALARGLLEAAQGRADLARRHYETAKSLRATAAPLRVLERRLANR